MRGGKALAQQRPALTTTETAASPLTIVAALPRALSAALPGRLRARAWKAEGAAVEQRLEALGEVYFDDGESVQVGSSLCHFMSINASVAPTPGGRVAGQALLLFGSRSLHLGTGGAGSSGCASSNRADSPGACLPVDDRASVGAAGDLGFEWPELGGLEVLGWGLPLDPGVPLRMELVQRADSCGRVMVLDSMDLATSSASVEGGLLRVDLGDVNHRLRCPVGVRLSWASAAVGGPSHRPGAVEAA